jgi:hypothetical protein
MVAGRTKNGGFILLDKIVGNPVGHLFPLFPEPGGAHVKSVVIHNFSF